MLLRERIDKTSTVHFLGIDALSLIHIYYIRVGEGMKTRKTEQNARENYKKAYFLMIVVSTILFCTAIGCQKKVDTSLKAQSSIVEYTCISDSDSDKSFYVILKNYHGVYWETVIEGVSKAANEIDASVYLGGIDNETDIEGQIKLIDEAIESGASGILLAPATSDELVESCKKARESGIYVALIDSSINPVSYTHLDVYKRQGRYYHFYSRSACYYCTCCLCICTFEFSGKKAYAFVNVSYTYDSRRDVNYYKLHYYHKVKMDQYLSGNDRSVFSECILYLLADTVLFTGTRCTLSGGKG